MENVFDDLEAIFDINEQYYKDAEQMFADILKEFYEIDFVKFYYSAKYGRNILEIYFANGVFIDEYKERNIAQHKEFCNQLKAMTIIKTEEEAEAFMFIDDVQTDDEQAIEFITDEICERIHHCKYYKSTDIVDVFML